MNIDERYGKEFILDIPRTEEDIIGIFKLRAAKWAKPLPVNKVENESTENA